MQELKSKFSIFAITLDAECWLLSANEKHILLNESEFSSKINTCTKWQTRKVSMRGLKFWRTDVTPPINIVESAECKTIIRLSGSMLQKKFAKLR